MSKPVGMNAHELNKIEPPLHIATKQEGFKVMVSVLDTLKTYTNEADASCPGVVVMLFLKFNSMADGDAWGENLFGNAQHFWKNTCKKTSPLHFLQANNTYDNTCDIFIAETKETVEMLAKMRFPESDIGC
jgi:hypothetical protein